MSLILASPLATVVIIGALFALLGWIVWWALSYDTAIYHPDELGPPRHVRLIDPPYDWDQE
jgi:hypothetical protein